MSATRIAIVFVGVVGLALAGFYSWPPGTGEGPPSVQGVAGPDARRQSPGATGSTQPGSPRFVTPRTAEASAPTSAAPGAVGSQGAAETHPHRANSDLQQALDTARQDLDSQRRIEALQFLGEHALQEHLEPLQQIQIQDPAPEVRHAAEKAIHLLIARFSGQPWPGIPTAEQPFDYMKGLSSPEAP